MMRLIDQNIGLAEVIQQRMGLQLLKTHPFKIPVDHTLTVHMDQPFCDVGQLKEPRDHQ